MIYLNCWPDGHVRSQIFLLLFELISHDDVISLGGAEGSQVEQSPNCCFQKNPFFLFHLHLILRLPNALYPGWQTVIHVDWSQFKLVAPSGRGNAGHKLHNALARTPTGNAHLSFRLRDIWRASKYVGWLHSSATDDPNNNDWFNFFNFLNNYIFTSGLTINLVLKKS